MIIVECRQGSPEWFAAKRGIPSASNIERIITPKGLKPSSQADAYRYKLLAEWATGETAMDAGSQFMQRGSELEAEARAWYELANGVEVQQVGFILNNDRTFGCSPDGLVGSDGDLEIKCFEAAHHVKALLEGDDDYVLQCQARLWVTGRAWCDRLYYNPAMPVVCRRLERDESLIATIAERVGEFLEQLEADRARLRELGCGLWQTNSDDTHTTAPQANETAAELFA